MWPWIVLIASGLFETVWAANLARITSIRDWEPIGLFVAGSVLSVGGLFWAMKFIPLGTAYACWTGIGAVATAIYGIYFLSESTSLPRLFFLSLIVIGLVGLNLTTK